MLGFIGDATVVTIEMRASTLRASGGILLPAAAIAFSLGVGDNIIVADEGPQISWQ